MPDAPDWLEKAAHSFQRRNEPGRLEESIRLVEENDPHSMAMATRCMLIGQWDRAFDIFAQEVLAGRYAPDPEHVAMKGFDKHAFLAAHRGLSNMQQLDVVSLVGNAIGVCEGHFQDDSIDVQLQQTNNVPPILGDANALRRVFLIVIENAFDAILDMEHMYDTILPDPQQYHLSWYDPSETVKKRLQHRIELHLKYNPSAKDVLFVCRDYGIGLPRPWLFARDELEHWIGRRKHLFGGDVARTETFIRGVVPLNEAELEAWLFRPGWTSKGKGHRRKREPLENGPGFGLYMARQILRKHAGSILVQRAAEGGTAVVMTIPVSAMPCDHTK